jgi:exodeoxyribonuclease VII small subunit
MKNSQTYKEAITELESIASAMEENEISIDELAQKVARANSLISFCEAKLKETEAAVKTVIAEGLEVSSGE